ncbi:MAG: glycosyltransferase family 39 protein [Candidatus Omnitrophica bacterium]|nr:glycosyltransferase family 39 protein [Candidatus Omnitrophota bacterium]
MLLLIFRHDNRPDPLNFIFLSPGLGLGISAGIVFLNFIIFDQLNRGFILTCHGVLLLSFILWNIKIFFSDKNHFTWITPQQTKHILWLFALIILSIPLWYQAHFYIFGGWDAWSTWNLKGRFLFLGGENWKNLFNPILWRASPHYPLLLPFINVWGWIFLDYPQYQVPAFTSFLFTFSTIGLLYTGLKQLTKSNAGILLAGALLTLPNYLKLAFSQYCDIIISYYMLGSLFCLICTRKTNHKSYMILAGLFVGFLSFAKSEGLMAAVIISTLSFPFLWWRNPSTEKRKLLKYFLIAAFVAFIPTIIFHVFYQPENQTFINGIVSSEKPSNFLRLKIILGFYLLEIGAPIWNIITLFNSSLQTIDAKWNGLWIIIILGLILSKGKCFRPKMMLIPLFLLLYILAFTAYYYINTYFEIGWWLQVTLHRLLFALLPTVLFWFFYAVWDDNAADVE